MLWEYTCETCGKTHEVIRKLEQRDLPFFCPCGGATKRVQICRTSFTMPGFCNGQNVTVD